MGNNPANSSGQDGKFFSGFLLGLVVGGVVVFLLGTKKGKRVWKAISEDGIDNISNLLDEAEKTEDLDEVEDEELGEVVEKPPFAKASEGRGEFAIKEKPVEKPRVRRFFRGISRRLN